MKRKRVGFRSSVLIKELTANQVMKVVGRKIYEAVKKQDKHPLFATIRVAEEGESTGQMEVKPGVWENTAKFWPAHIIKQIAAALKPENGVFKKLWDRHSDKNDPLGKFNIQHGDVLGTRTFEKEGKQVTDAIVYVQPGNVRDKIKNKKRDIASIEGFVEFVKKAGRWVAERVDTLMGIALASSEWDKAGFAGARVLALVQELEGDEEEEEEEPKPRGRTGKRRKGRMEFDLTEVKVWIGQQDIKPEQLYGSEGLVKSAIVEGAIKSAVDNAVAEAVTEQKTTIDALEKDKKTLEDSVKAKDEERSKIESDLGEFRSVQNRTKLSEVIKESEALKDATVKEVDYIVEQMDPAIMDIEDLKKRGEKIEAGIGKAKEDIERLGINFDKPAGGGGEGGGGGGGEGGGEKDNEQINPLTGDKVSTQGEEGIE